MFLELPSCLVKAQHNVLNYLETKRKSFHISRASVSRMRFAYLQVDLNLCDVVYARGLASS